VALRIVRRLRQAGRASRLLGDFKKQTLRLRAGISAPFSKRYRTRLRWLREEPLWRAQGIPQSDVIKALLYIEETGAFYLPVHKAAHTSILAAIAKSVPSNPLDNLPHHMSRLPNTLDLGCGPEDFRSGARVAFTAVRHPLDRFWSAYNFGVIEGTGGELEAAIRRALRLAADRPISPELLLDYVESTVVEEIDRHFRPQYAICGLAMLPLKIARCESLVEDLARLAEEGYFPKGSLGHLAALNRRQSRQVHDRHRALDRRVEQVYGRDFAELGY
jgi:hypothetical protein